MPAVTVRDKLPDTERQGPVVLCSLHFLNSGPSGPQGEGLRGAGHCGQALGQPPGQAGAH